MRLIHLLSLTLVVVLLQSCSTDESDLGGEFQFVSDYTATITVGGFVGVIDRTFYIGETYEGTDNGKATIRIRIAEHTERNEDCPNSWCYQEHLEVPRKLLQRVD